MWGYGDMMGWGGGWGILGMVLWPLILIALIVGVVWVLRSRADELGPKRPSARDILEERYARGEINRDEYLEKKRDISG